MLAAGGVTLVQLRDKLSDTRVMVERARAIKAALGRVPLLINDRVDVALAIGADGVHIGWDDMAPADARRLLGPDAIIGLTINSPQRADATDLDLIDYAGIGGVYGTTSKVTKNSPIGLAGMARVIEALHRRKPGFPTCGIAGINAGNAAPVIEAGADGVSVISALSLATDPRAAAADLLRVGRCGARQAEAQMTAIAVTIAGSDSGGGAGIQADLKTFSALGVYGASVITALTAQNTKGVTGIHDVPPDFIAAQIDAVFSDLAVGAVKIGMLSHAATIAAVAAGLDRHQPDQCRARPGDGRDLRRPAARARGGRQPAPHAHPARAGDHAEPAGGGRAARYRGCGNRDRHVSIRCRRATTSVPPGAQSRPTTPRICGVTHLPSRASSGCCPSSGSRRSRRPACSPGAPMAWTWCCASCWPASARA